MAARPAARPTSSPSPRPPPPPPPRPRPPQLHLGRLGRRNRLLLLSGKRGRRPRVAARRGDAGARERAVERERPVDAPHQVVEDAREKIALATASRACAAAGRRERHPERRPPASILRSQRAWRLMAAGRFSSRTCATAPRSALPAPDLAPVDPRLPSSVRDSSARCRWSSPARIRMSWRRCGGVMPMHPIASSVSCSVSPPPPPPRWCARRSACRCTPRRQQVSALARAIFRPASSWWKMW